VRLADQDWSQLDGMNVHDGAQFVTATVLFIAEQFIPKRTLREHKATHPWVNNRVLELVAAKRAAEGTAREEECRKACSAAIMDEYGKYVARERSELQAMRRGLKQWWSKARRLMQRKNRLSSVPALRDTSGQWLMDAKCKADLFVKTFSQKCTLPADERNEYSEIIMSPGGAQTVLPLVSERDAEQMLGALREDSGTGPDLLPARILKYCASELAKPVHMLTLLILSTGAWPELWRQHWITPLYKKKSTFCADNYRGIHLTAELSKVVDRLIKALFMPFITLHTGFGPNQFAYTVERGARDALAVLVLKWTQSLALGRKIAVYCSDVAGAFDRVKVERLIEKLKAKKLHPDIVAVLSSWLRHRTSHIVVGGAQSDEMLLINMIFQGTVLGPPLWNIFFEDARLAVNELSFTEAVYADDLNAYRVFPGCIENKVLQKSMEACQNKLHAWGRANQVSFDPAKESQHILSLTEPVGGVFRLLGVIFDGALTMSDTVSEMVTEAGWKLRTIIRTRRYYTDAELILLYKAHLLSYLEYWTPAVYHCTRALLERLDAVQSRFLRQAGVDEVTALIEFHLAPLSVRRDIAMLGMIHRTAVGRGPPPFKEFFQRSEAGIGQRHNRHLSDPLAGGRKSLPKISALGLVAVYNMLPPAVVAPTSVSAFQKILQGLVTARATAGCGNWKETLSPRLALHRHSLK
jgi:hypothetical protein